MNSRERLDAALNHQQPDRVPVDFMLLGPDEVRGFQAGVNVPSCPKCNARVEACMCPK